MRDVILNIHGIGDPDRAPPAGARRGALLDLRRAVARGSGACRGRNGDGPGAGAVHL